MLCLYNILLMKMKQSIECTYSLLENVELSGQTFKWETENSQLPGDAGCLLVERGSDARNARRVVFWGNDLWPRGSSGRVPLRIEQSSVSHCFSASTVNIVVHVQYFFHNYSSENNNKWKLLAFMKILWYFSHYNDNG